MKFVKARCAIRLQMTITIPASGDSDGDGVTDAQESIDGTDPRIIHVV
ncbi:MAG: hypothetical protein IPO48_21125 [Saprospiraceae bacterium]|nr:hypothetical protein [Saprospiraceae bacterium]